jgi:hypothetical protein
MMAREAIDRVLLRGLALLLLLLSGTTRAAEVAGVNHDGDYSVRITGPIASGDYDHVAAMLKGGLVNRVELDSDGGALGEALAIGRLIYKKKLDTVVADGKTCASACGIIWLAGRHRVIEGAGRVGFHAIYLNDGSQDISSDGNALVGAYFNGLGLSTDAIVYLTHAKPTDMRWFTPADAWYLAIDTEWRRPNPPHPNLVGRMAVEYSVKKERLGALLTKDHPLEYQQFVSDVYDAQMAGQDWPNAMRNATISLRLPQLEDAALHNALIGTFGQQLIDITYVRFGAYLVGRNDAGCDKLFSDNAEPAAQLFKDGPDDLKAAYLGYIADATEFALKSNPKPGANAPATSADRAYMKSQIKKLLRKAYSQLSKAEQRRLAAAKPGAEVVLRCKISIAALRAGEADRRLVRALLQPDLAKPKQPQPKG